VGESRAERADSGGRRLKRKREILLGSVEKKSKRNLEEGSVLLRLVPAPSPAMTARSPPLPSSTTAACLSGLVSFLPLALFPSFVMLPVVGSVWAL